VPAGWYEDSAQTLTLNIGASFLLDNEGVSAGITRHQLDRQLAAFAMDKIAALLPKALRGRYN
jgi:hypothetical protein